MKYLITLKSTPRYFYRLLLILIVCPLFLLSKNRTCQTECVTFETDGYIIVKIWDTKKGAKYKAQEARKDAIYAFLYSGIAGGIGCSAQPPILLSLEDQDKFNAIKNTFFSRDGHWIQYTKNATTATSLPINLGPDNWKVYQVAVSKNEIRKYLENQKIIKSLNNGF